MRQFKMVVLAVLAVSGLMLAVGCGGEELNTGLDRTSAQATGNRPVATEVELLQIPYDPGKEIVEVVVEPLEMGASGVTSGGGEVIDPGPQNGAAITALLITALGHDGNIRVIEYDAYQRLGPEKFAEECRNRGHVGPFIIKGTATEFDQRADASVRGEHSGPNLGLLAVPYAGGLLMAAQGTKSKVDSTCTGMVALDLRIVDPVTNLMVAPIVSQGSFTTHGVVVTRTRFNNTKMAGDKAASGISQAERIATNDAVPKINAVVVKSKTTTRPAGMAENR